MLTTAQSIALLIISGCIGWMLWAFAMYLDWHKKQNDLDKHINEANEKLEEIKRHDNKVRSYWYQLIWAHPQPSGRTIYTSSLLGRGSQHLRMSDLADIRASHGIPPSAFLFNAVFLGYMTKEQLDPRHTIEFADLESEDMAPSRRKEQNRPRARPRHLHLATFKGKEIE